MMWKRRVIAAALFSICTVAQAEQWQELEARDRPITVTASGVVASREALRFGPPPSQSWRITITKLAREGTRVKKGDVLAEFDGAATDDRLNQRQADLGQKQSELASLREAQAREIEDDKVRLAAAKSDADKAARKASVDPQVYAGLEYRKLVEERRATEDTYRREQSRTALVARVRQSKLAELEADIRRLESEVAGAKAELESFTIRSPRDGLVIVGTDQQGQKLDANDAVNPGMTVVEVINDQVLVIEAEVPEFAAASLAVGQSARVALDVAGSGELQGTIVEVSSIVRRQSRFSQAMVRDVSIQLEDDTVPLRPGMSTQVTLVVDTISNALAVPEQALRYRDGQPGLMVRGDGWQPVTLGGLSAGLRIIVDGVDAGKEIAL
ncbi:MAG: HlyD family efflux transporter periplasmic adaptor subunit [Pseudomonadota bacterium]